MSGLAFKAMRQAAARQKPMADRVEMLVHRRALLQWMERTEDPLLPKFRATSGGQAKDSTEASKPGGPPPKEPQP